MIRLAPTDKGKKRMRYALMARLMRKAPRRGSFLEIGVYRGKSARVIYIMAQSQKERKCYFYDTFEGHPHPFNRAKEPINGIGAHVPKSHDLASLIKDCPDAVITKGEFPYSAVKMQSIAFAHVDVDSYLSTRNTIAYIKPRMRRGGIILFDDYRKHPEAKSAVHEFFEAHQLHIVPILGRAFTVIGYDTNDMAREWRLK